MNITSAEERKKALYKAAVKFNDGKQCYFYSKDKIKGEINMDIGFKRLVKMIEQTFKGKVKCAAIYYAHEVDGKEIAKWIDGERII